MQYRLTIENLVKALREIYKAEHDINKLMHSTNIIRKKGDDMADITINGDESYAAIIRKFGGKK